MLQHAWILLSDLVLHSLAAGLGSNIQAKEDLYSVVGILNVQYLGSYSVMDSEDSM